MDNKDKSTQYKPTNKLRRIKGSDIPIAQEILLLACFSLETYERTQKQIFCSLMPTLYMLKTEQNFTFKQITSLLNESGIRLSESSVRIYYSEFLSCSEQEYQQETDKQKRFFEVLQRILKNYAHLPPSEIAQLISDNMT